MKKLLFLAVAFIAANVSKAQSVDTYIFKVENGKDYTPLTTGTNITAGLIWDDEAFKVPLGFTSKIGDKLINHFCIASEGVLAPSSDTEGVINSFGPYLADLRDRSMTTTPMSPVKYLLSGITPNRIFKVEFQNAGFYSEIMDYSTNNDFVNFQVWLYETSNIVEFRYGSSKVSYPSDYFDGAAPIIGYIKNLSYTTFDLEKLYSLNGAPTAPEIDSTVTIGSTPPLLSAPPAMGTVYRFVPKDVAASIGEVDITASINVYPTIVASVINVDYKTVVPGKAEIMNVSGQLINSATDLINGSNTINVNILPSGNYLIKVSNAEGNAVYKFVKQ